MIRDQATVDALIETIHRFVDEVLVPAELEVETSGEVPRRIVDEMKVLGLFGMSIPEAYGGLGLTVEEEILVAFQIGRTSPAFRSVFGTNNGIGSQGLVADGTTAQKARWLPALASGDQISSFALTEPDAGSDAANLTTTARREGDVYVLNGTKRYITNAPTASVFTVMARTGGSGASGISAFLVPRDAPGLSLGKPDRKMGQRGTQTCDVIFADSVIPAENLLGGQEGLGFRTAMKVLNRGRLHIAAVCVGMADRLIAEMVKYSSERRQFGQPISNFQLIQAMIADSATESYAARSMVLDAARILDRGEKAIKEASCCKLFSSEMVGRVADRAVQVHGGAGYMAEYPVERFYRDARLFRIYEGTSQIQQMVIAKEILKAG